MKLLKSIVMIVFSLVIILPCVFFNFENKAVSTIDNRMLSPFPSKNNEGSLTTQVDNFINDRIGLREEMIHTYTMLNDKVFGKLTHPSYVKGQAGYIYGTEATKAVEYTEYHQDFAQMVAKIQTYCNERNIPFVFVFNPGKSSVLTEYLPKGVNQNRDWVRTFFDQLDRLGVNYVDNTSVLREQWQAGEAVFNRQFDANHWNDWGAFYGTNAALLALKKQIPNVYVNQKSDLTVTYESQTKLPNSTYPIQEETPVISLNTSVTSVAADYQDEVTRHPSYQGFGYFVNERRKAEGAPKALVFQGSYMNGCGAKFFANSFGEYIYVHDYQNVMNFDYYYNIFQPDCVVFEVAEYTFTEGYFSQETMQNMELNPVRSNFDQSQLITANVSKTDFAIVRGDMVTTLYYDCDKNDRFAWITLDRDYDMIEGTRYSVTVPTEVFDAYQNQMQITFQK